MARVHQARPGPQPAHIRVSSRTVALVVPGLTEGGGVPISARFIKHTLTTSGRYEPTLISLPMGSHDPTHLRLARPAGWARGEQVSHGVWEGHPYTEVGAVGGEVEVLRMAPRRRLTALLNGFDLVHVVAGVPAWATVAARVTPPVLLYAATLTHVEREALLRTGRGARNVWRSAMTQAAIRMDVSALRHVRAAFSINEWMRRWLVERMPSGTTVRLAPPGVDTDRFQPTPPGEANAAGGARYILAVGRFHDPRKNVRMLFGAYARLRALVRDAPELVLAGATEPTPADWAVAQRLGVLGHVTMRTGVSEEDLASLYGGATALALSSDEEGLGIVLLEAMASGVPVVSTDCGGPATCVLDGVTGYLTPVGDADALATRLAALCADEPARLAMSARARAHVRAHFSLEAAGRVFLDVYDDVTDRVTSGAETR